MFFSSYLYSDVAVATKEVRFGLFTSRITRYVWRFHILPDPVSVDSRKRVNDGKDGLPVSLTRWLRYRFVDHRAWYHLSVGY